MCKKFIVIFRALSNFPNNELENLLNSTKYNVITLPILKIENIYTKPINTLKAQAVLVTSSAEFTWAVSSTFANIFCFRRGILHGDQFFVIPIQELYHSFQNQHKIYYLFYLSIIFGELLGVY